MSKGKFRILLPHPHAFSNSVCGHFIQELLRPKSLINVTLDLIPGLCYFLPLSLFAHICSASNPANSTLKIRFQIQLPSIILPIITLIHAVVNTPGITAGTSSLPVLLPPVMSKHERITLAAKVHRLHYHSAQNPSMDFHLTP